MATTRSTTKVRYCTFCAHGSHRLCAGSSASGDECACRARRHDPCVEVAAEMRVYVRPDLRKLPIEVLATQWRQQTSRVKT